MAKKDKQSTTSSGQKPQDTKNEWTSPTKEKRKVNRSI